MSLQAASLGRFWLGPQTAKATAATTFYGFKANLVDVAPSQQYRNVGQVVGGNLLPGGSVKTAAWSGGSVVMPPPLDDYIGWLLYAFAGTVSTVDNGDDTYTHYFPAGADSTVPSKYLTGRRSIPGAATLYEQMEDLVPYRLLFGLTPGEFATLRAEMVGRTPIAVDGSGWSFSAKDDNSVPISCKGIFSLPDGNEIETATAVSLEIANMIPDLQRVLTLGSYYPFDFPVLGRAITLSFSYLWENKTLYESLYYSSGAWNPLIYNSSVSLEVESPDVITGSLPYKLKFYGQSVDWTCQPVRLAGGELVEIAMSGTVAGAASGHDWYLALTNGTASYTWPTT
jgi:hypothetical protein